MGKEFLRAVAELFYAREGDNLSNICFVFPNRRSSVFFRRYLGECVKKPVFAPTLITVNDLFTKLSGLRLLDRITLMHRLYMVFKTELEDFKESFDEFIFRADVVLNDFDDIDKYLVDAGKLYSNIQDLKEIESRYDYLSDSQREAIKSFWGIMLENCEGEKEKQFLKMWQSMHRIYECFRSDLLALGEAYEGLIYRQIAEKAARQDLVLMARLEEYDRLVFVGLNAPNKCERCLFDELRKNGRGDFYWDFYGRTIQDPANKASLFMKENISRYPSQYTLSPDVQPSESGPEVEAVAVPSAVGQAKYVTRILDRIRQESGDMDLLSTAILLPDEKMLFPLLNSLPEYISSINVTMGYSLAHSSVASFVAAVASLQERVRKTGRQVQFYSKDAVEMLRHPFLAAVMQGESADLIERILKENIIYIRPSFFEDYPLLRNIFYVPEPSGLPEYLRSVLNSVMPVLDKVDRHFFEGYQKCINLLQSLNIEMMPSTFFRLLRRVETTVSIPFKGEPLEGLQVMGPLEIRALDFENVIILSANEGTFPARNTAVSMVPFNLRSGFGLPTYEYQDSIAAYHFYRSICRAKRVWMIYDSRNEGTSAGEESRYIKQLEYHHGYPIRRSTVSFGMQADTLEKPVIKKTAEHLDILQKRNFSPSSMSLWNQCRKRFYYQYVEGLEEGKELEEGINAADFGSLFHYVMENLYKPYVGGVVSSEELLKLSQDRKRIESLIDRGFKDKLKISEVMGRNLLVKAPMTLMVAGTLEKEASLAPITVETLEKYHGSTYETKGGVKVSLGGYIDRLDRVGGKLRILDYKTGQQRIRQDLEDMFSTDSERSLKCKDAFQLYVYLLILELNGTHNIDLENTELEIYYTTTLFDKKTGRGKRTCIDFIPEEYARFKKSLSDLIDSIFDLNVDFTPTDDNKNCENCPFLKLCNS